MCVCVYECLLLILILFWLLVNFWHPVVMFLKYVKSCLRYLNAAASNVFAWDHNVTKSQLYLCCILPWHAFGCIFADFFLSFLFHFGFLLYGECSFVYSYRIHCCAALNSCQCFYFVSVEFLNIFSIVSLLDFFPHRVPLHNLAVLLGSFHFTKCIRINDSFF